MAIISWQLGRTAITDALTAVIAGGSAVLLVVFRANSTWLILGGGVVGLVARLVAG
jgi:chromate transporter